MRPMSPVPRRNIAPGIGTGADSGSLMMVSEMVSPLYETDIHISEIVETFQLPPNTASNIPHLYPP